MSFLEQSTSVANILTAAVYIIIISLFIISGYIIRANSLYKSTSQVLPDNIASNAWYPILSVIPMAKAAGCKFWYAIAATGLFTIGLVVAPLLCVLGVISVKIAAAIIIPLYLIHSTCHLFVLQAYMNKLRPEVDDMVIILSSYLPLLKMYIHGNF